MAAARALHAMAGALVVELLGHRWPQALHAAETGLELAIQADATILKAIFSNAVWRRCSVPTTSTPRWSECRGSPPCRAGSGHYGDPVHRNLCTAAGIKRRSGGHERSPRADVRPVPNRRVESLRRVLPGLLPPCPLGESARVGGAFRRLRRTGHPNRLGMPDFEHLRDAARAELAAKIEPVRLEALYAEGAKLEPEAVCRLTLGYE